MPNPILPKSVGGEKTRVAKWRKYISQSKIIKDQCDTYRTRECTTLIFSCKKEQNDFFDFRNKDLAALTEGGTAFLLISLESPFSFFSFLPFRLFLHEAKTGHGIVRVVVDGVVSIPFVGPVRDNDVTDVGMFVRRRRMERDGNDVAFDQSLILFRPFPFFTSAYFFFPGSGGGRVASTAKFMFINAGNLGRKKKEGAA